MKEAFHDFLAICSLDLSDRQKVEESIHDIRRYVEKRSRFLDARPSPSPPPSHLCGPSRERSEWTRLCIYEKKKKMSIESVTTCACNYSLREKSTKRLRALARLMGSRVRRVYHIFIVHAHVYACICV